MSELKLEIHTKSLVFEDHWDAEISIHPRISNNL